MNFHKFQQSIIESNKIGANTYIREFIHILPDATIGANCNIYDHVFIDNDVVVGDRVIIKSGVQLWDGTRIEDDVYIGPNVTFTNDRFQQGRQNRETSSQTYIKKGASIGANSTILPGITIGKNAIVDCGAVVTKDVPPNAIAVGNPAYITGYVSALNSKHPSTIEVPTQSSPMVLTSAIKGVKIHNLPMIIDMRGSLSVAEYGQYLPFIPKRYFLVFDVKSREIRGEHAHRTLHQFLVCVKGSCALVVDDGQNSQEIILDRPNIGVHLPPMVWGIQYKYTPDAVLLVLASDIYNADDYIRNYDEFLKETTQI